MLAAVQALLVRLIEGNVSDKHISSLLRENLNLLARKVVDRTGDTGEHYIANSKPEYWQMWRAAIGGGLLTVFTAAVKLRIIEAHPPPFVEGFASGTNYAISFILLQAFRPGACDQATGNDRCRLRQDHPRQSRPGTFEQAHRFRRSHHQHAVGRGHRQRRSGVSRCGVI